MLMLAVVIVDAIQWSEAVCPIVIYFINPKPELRPNVA
jgi:hypothetical protein